MHPNCLHPHIASQSHSLDDETNVMCPLCTSSFPFNHILSNSDFQSAVTHDQPPPPPLPLTNADLFDPFMLTHDDERDHSGLVDADPDTNFFHSLINSMSEYYDTNSFIRTTEQQQFTLSLLHLNIRSLQSNLNHFTTHISLLNHNFPIIALTETWLTDVNHDIYSIPGYNHTYDYRRNRVGGGVSIFSRNDLQFTERRDLSLMTETLEAVFIEIDKSAFHTKRCVIVGSVYRPPNTSMEDFNQLMADLLTKIHREGKRCFIAGDFNVNLLDIPNHPPSNNFIDLMFAHSFYPLINRPTRPASNTLIDNIFCNTPETAPELCGALLTDISDHYPIFCIFRNLEWNLQPQANHTKTRNYISGNIDRFTDACNNTDWNATLSETDCQTAYTNFHTTLSSLYNSCFPIQKHNTHSIYKLRKPWLSLALKTSIKTKNKLYLKFKKHPTEHNRTSYNTYRRRLQNLLREAEKHHFSSLLEQHRNNMKKTWIVIKEAIGIEKQRRMGKNFNINGNSVTDPIDIANSFNKYFATVGTELAKNIQPSSVEPDQLITSNPAESLFFQAASRDEIFSTFKSLKITSPGWDGISAKVVLKSFHSFLSPLTHVLNLSLQQGVVPRELKVAKVTPIFKSGSLSTLSNYRPISILPVLSKILEKLVHSRITKFLDKHSLLNPSQFGFRSNRNTTLALINIIDNLTQTLQSKRTSIGLFIDFRKAFDCVDHEILVKKLKKYGIRGLPLSWIASYLKDRKQFVVFDGHSSETLNLTCGVPQGSILGPLLFLLYVNDISSATGLSSCLYADDANFFASGDNVEELIDTMNSEITKILDWTKSNKLTINEEKTHYIIFSLKSQTNNPSKEIMLNNSPLQRKEVTKFLGVYIDRKLTFKDHLIHIKPKIAKSIGILNKVKHKLPTQTLITLYYTLICPYLTYGIEVWGSTASSFTLPIFKLQKRALRIITNSHPRTPSLPLFAETKILTLKDLYIKSVMIFMYKINHNIFSTDLFQNMFTLKRNVHNHSTRNANVYTVPFVRIDISRRSIRSRGVFCWNSLHSTLESDTASISLFKQKLVTKLSTQPATHNIF